jgi:uncharacterized NAD(P)/FAD-binding protein YdhS
MSQIWQSLPEAEKRRFLRHLRPYWEVHRHRAAPEIARFMEEHRSTGMIQLHAGRIVGYREIGSRVEIRYHQRKNGEAGGFLADRVINCTPPETDCRRLQDPLMAALVAEGKVRPDPLFLGLDSSADGALVDRQGVISDSLYTLGSARKGSLWESTAVPEIRQQVYRLVRHLVSATAQSHPAALARGPEEPRPMTNA